MPTIHCECGAKYRFPESSIGKRAKCKKCGSVFTLEPEDDQGPIPLADDSEMRDDMAVPAEQAGAATARQGEVCAPPGTPGMVASMGLGTSAGAASTASTKGFASNVLWTFLFPSSPRNLIGFLCFWAAMVITGFVLYVPLIGWILWLLIIGWYCAFRFEIITSAAAGEEDLPDPPSPLFVIELIEPLLKWVGSWLVVLAPALVYFVYALDQGLLQGPSVQGVMTGGLAGVVQTATSGIPLFAVLVALGVFLWPMVILCVALGGFSTLLRLDLIILTIIRTFPIYVLVLALMFGAVLIEHALLAGVSGGSKGAMGGGAFALSVLGRGLDIYINIVLMRLIGLYYCHFKDRFAWSWG